MLKKMNYIEKDTMREHGVDGDADASGCLVDLFVYSKTYNITAGYNSWINTAISMHKMR